MNIYANIKYATTYLSFVSEDIRVEGEVIFGDEKVTLKQDIGH